MVIAFRARRLIDGTGVPAVENCVVVVEGERIVAAGPAASTEMPAGAKVVDLGDRTILPGFVDAHTHISLIPGMGNQSGQKKQPFAPQILRSVVNVRKMLRSGVTTARVMGEEYLLDVDVKKAIDDGQIPGPRLVIATRSITATNAHGAALTLSDGVDGVRKTARENLKAGAEFLKLFATGGMSSRVGVDRVCYSDAEIATIVEEAERGGTYVAAHAHGGKGMERCLVLGVRTIEHAGLATPELIDLAISKGAWLVGTFAIAFHPDGIERGDFHDPVIREKVTSGRKVKEAAWRRVLDSPVQWALGTDSMHGLISFEAAKVVELGASPMDAILAITSRAAAVCRAEDRVGTVQHGKLADLVAVPGNPLDDISALSRVDFILKGGRRFDHLSAD